MHRIALLLGLLAVACASEAAELTADPAPQRPELPGQPVPETHPARREPAPVATHFVIEGATLVSDGPGGVTSVLEPLEIDDGFIVARGDAVAPGLPAIDLSDQFLTPAVIDSHVHLSYFPVSAEMAAGGVAAVVDLAAPLDEIGQVEGPLRRLDAGPMVTAEQGYPTQSWGANGYGIECGNAEDCRAAVTQLAEAGVDLIKVPITPAPSHAVSTLVAIVDEAHAHNLRVAAHALDVSEVEIAATAGADVLAHTPAIGLLSTEAAAAWQGRGVISTLAAFGAGPDAIANLESLHDAGATVLYGTDNGNTQYLGIAEEELDRMLDAGLDHDEVLRSATSLPAAFWGLSDLGTIEPGRRASLLVLEEDPRLDVRVLATPVAVYIDGIRLEPE